MKKKQHKAGHYKKYVLTSKSIPLQADDPKEAAKGILARAVARGVITGMTDLPQIETKEDRAKKKKKKKQGKTKSENAPSEKGAKTKHKDKSKRKKNAVSDGDNNDDDVSYYVYE